MNCPRRHFHTGATKLRAVGLDEYLCSCGCRFKWYDDFKWTLIESDFRVCFDVDGVIADDRDDLPYSVRRPYPGMVELMSSLKSSGATIILFTARYMRRCRGDQELAAQEGIEELEEWCVTHNVPWDEMYFGKPSADLYIDDRGCRLCSNDGTIEERAKILLEAVNNAKLRV